MQSSEEQSSGTRLFPEGISPTYSSTSLCAQFPHIGTLESPANAPSIATPQAVTKAGGYYSGKERQEMVGGSPPNRKELLKQAVWRYRWHITAGGVLLLVALSMFIFTHLDESPVTGRTRLLLFSRENFMDLANATSEGYMELYKESFIPLEDPRHKVVETVVKHLAQRNQDIEELSRVPWSVHVVDNPAINAFVLPNGKVFIFTGMLEAVADIHQLTFILGHEMAHALIGHSAEQASLSHLLDVLSLLVLTAIWAVCPQDSLAALGHWVQGKLVQVMFNRPFSRKLEAEADKVGLQLAAKACADVRAGPVFWQQMEISDQLRGDTNVPEWLSTHPSHRNRIAQLDRLVPEALELRAACECPALPGTDPRTIFSKSVKLLLNSVQVKGQDGEHKGTGGLGALTPAQVPAVANQGAQPQLAAPPSLPQAGALGAPPSLPQAGVLGAPPSFPQAGALGAPPSLPQAGVLGAPPSLPQALVSKQAELPPPRKLEEEPKTS
ncbi:hypothetical protein COCON_G00060610 [Conger conger]|uniref:Metalloendopeptidase OMA1, mitochondrial n=1 Tax=Conger conger TaxID=82655 RepID=A0A9Q1DRC5_CONCO|nr:hypothetical protein COCON_G00060610 [Conger conger]